MKRYFTRLFFAVLGKDLPTKTESLDAIRPFCKIDIETVIKGSDLVTILKRGGEGSAPST